MTFLATVTDGKIAVPAGVPCPDGTTVLITVPVPVPVPVPEPATVPEPPAEVPPWLRVYPDGPIGMWADREDMADSVKWVQQQRAKWRERVQRRD